MLILMSDETPIITNYPNRNFYKKSSFLGEIMLLSDNVEVILNELCINKVLAEGQRDLELDRLGHTSNCHGYYVTGCYFCNGFDRECEKYYSDKYLLGKIRDSNKYLTRILKV